MRNTSIYLAIYVMGLVLVPSSVFSQEAPGKADSPSESSTTAVKSKGQGETPDKAEKSALIRAVVKAVGALVDQETLVKNDEVIRDQILSVSSGFVKSFKVIEEAKKNLEGDFETVLEVVVEKRKLEKSLSEKGLVKASSSAKDIWAENLSKNATAEDAMRMLEAKLPALIERLFSVSFFEENPKPTLLSRDSSSGTAKLLWWVKLSSDTNFWYSQAAPMFDACLSAIQENERDDVSIKGEGKPFVVALSQPLSGANVEIDDFKSFDISPSKRQTLQKSVGFPILDIKVKAAQSVLAAQILNLNFGVESLTTFLGNGNFRGRFYLADLGNNRVNYPNADRMRNEVMNQPVLKKFVDSKPKDVPLGRAFFFMPFVSTDGSSGHLYPHSETEPYQLSSKAEDFIMRWAESRVFFAPETVVNGQSKYSSHGKSAIGNKGWWRAGGSGVAFPIILDLPIEETKNALELAIKVRSSADQHKSTGH